MQQNKTFRFNKRIIENIIPEKTITTYHDSSTRGLKLLVRPSGTKTFILYRKIQGRPERITIGRFPDLSIEQVRAKCSEHNASIANGVNPAEKRRRVSHEMTFSELFQLFLDRHAKLHKKTWREDVNIFRLYCSSLAKQRLSRIRKIDLQRLHAKIGSDNGIYIANRLLALIRAMYNRGIDWGLEYSNPTRGIKKYKEHSRDRFLQADELPRLFESLAQEPNDTVRDFVLICLFTGARRSNVQSMRWADVNLQTNLWKIPMTKNGEPHTVPLVEAAMKVLNIRHAKRKDSPFVFPSHGKTGHLVEPKNSWENIIKRAGIKNLRLHDLRRSLGSWQAVTGASLSIIGKTLAHKDISTTAIYARLNLDPVRAAMDKATEAMLKATNVDVSK